MQVVNYNKPVMSSREIAEQAGKMHKHVMESIRRMEPAWEKVNGSRFGLVEYKDGKGEMRPEYLLTKTETLYIATKFNDEARARLVLRWEELETQQQPANTLDQLLQQASLELQLKIEQRDKLNIEIEQYRRTVSIINHPQMVLEHHINTYTLDFLNKYIPLWKLRGYVLANEFRVLYNPHVSFDDRIGVKALFQSVEDYCTANNIIFTKNKQKRYRNKTMRVHLFE